ncbi:ABC-type cobalt transport system, ATPase component [Beggiatoa alba B18LD]|uniref:ABC-type cobalt transport system, ATPase component n=1 Tax=Beggiatoa alba B18LD TaxID=395493 RepID=I3CBV1_9GAMM|nr:ABC transporter ATP-binding protein [Beggiatoa alba]EIJ41094.1 ABC-type cobalt transport system, ATPase component [Beggiatoa alba B18LD]
MTMPLLTLKNLKILQQKRLILDIPSLTIATQGCVVLNGRNGSGKTTLLKVIAGLFAPQQAQVVWGTTDKPQTWQKARSHLITQTVYLHQQPYLFDMSVTENIAYGLRQLSLPRQTVLTKVKQALAWAELEHLANRHARQLSGGEKQRVALTRARVLSPRLLLLDEPTASMDKTAKEQTYSLIRRLVAENVSVILTSHELENHVPFNDSSLWSLEAGQLSIHAHSPLSTCVRG